VRRRHAVVFDGDLRDLTLQTIQVCREIVQTKVTPKAFYKAKKCRNCSLIDQCHPQDFTRSASAWLAQQLAEG
jgi:CRISPR-associated exonuclease Cas4